MSFLAYIGSFIGVLAAAGLFFGIPWLLLYRRFFGVPRVYLLLAVGGAYVTLLYLKPAFLNLWVLPTVTVALALAFHFYRKGGREPFLAPLKFWPAIAILVYCFLLFAFRWEPPGVDSTKWGALARVIFETATVPGESRAIASLKELRGASLGLPTVMAVTHLSKLPLERIVGFFQSASLAIFIFALASALMSWFSREASTMAAFFALVLFSTPQAHLAWGSTPALIGMTAGFGVLELVKLCVLRRPTIPELVVYSLAVVFAAHAHPVGCYLSLLLCVPVAIWWLVSSKRWREASATFAAWTLMTLLIFAPFIAHWRFLPNADELAQVRRWQTAQLLQIDRFLSAGAGLAMLWLMVAIGSDRKQRFIIPAILMSAGLLLLLWNVKWWLLPLSHLLYPEPIVTLLAFPLAMPFAWFCERRRWRWAFVVFFALGLREFQHWILPHIGQSRITANDRAAMAVVEKEVPWDECIDVRGSEAGIWIPVLAVRCTVEFPAKGLHVVDEETGAVRERPRWTYFADKEKKYDVPGSEIVYDRGARLLRRE